MSFLSIAPKLFYFDVRSDLSDFLSRHTNLFAVSGLRFEEGSPSFSFMGQSARTSILLHWVSFEFSLNFGGSFVFTHFCFWFCLTLSAHLSFGGIFYGDRFFLRWFVLTISLFSFLTTWLSNYSFFFSFLILWVVLLIILMAIQIRFFRLNFRKSTFF